MRLEKIKLAGFKSFVDPTVIHFPSNLVGVVGPNGCGKSNVIDAVRWVMGESSAKMLRGESMADVIFNGSSSRKPVGLASIELVFDNAQGRAGGQYAQYTQISIRRQVTRDGHSDYYLNNVRCRRRDIMDVFLGTGLGPRSYSVIEQGMISRIVEARPEELRAYLEEAAGISKYKERRRETENRIRHTRENLERLNDLREEVQKQLRHLERQAATAKKYQDLTQQERRTRAEWQVLRWSALQNETVRQEQYLAQQEATLQAALKEQQAVEQDIEHRRTEQATAHESFNQVQGRFYAVSADVTRLEGVIQHAQDNQQRQLAELQRSQQALREAEQRHEQDQAKLVDLRQALAHIQPRLSSARDLEDQRQAQWQTVERAMQAWQVEWEAFQQQANQPVQQAQVERARINHLEQQIQQLQKRLRANQTETASLNEIDRQSEISQLRQRKQALESNRAQTKMDLDQAYQLIEQIQLAVRRTQDELDEVNAELQHLQGRLVSLQTLQMAAKGKDDKALQHWLNTQGLQDAPRLLEQVEVESPWQLAVEVVLEHRLQAILVDHLADYVDDGEALQASGVCLVTQQASPVAVRPGTLASVVQGPMALLAALNGIRLADDLAQALNWQAELDIGEFVITPQGILMGAGWLSIRPHLQAETGVLAREQELRELTRQQEVLAPRVEALQVAVTQSHQQEKSLEQQRRAMQKQYDDIAHGLSDVQSRLSSKQAHAEQAEHRLARLRLEADEMHQQLTDGQQQIRIAQTDLESALAQIASGDQQREQLHQQRDEYRAALQSAQQAMNESRQQTHQLNLEVRGLQSTEKSLCASIQRLDDQPMQLRRQVESVQAELSDNQKLMEQTQVDLKRKLHDKVEVEKTLAESRQALEALDTQLRELEQVRYQAEQAVQSGRSTRDDVKASHQESRARCQAMQERLDETGYTADQLLAELPEGAEEADWGAQAERLAAKIQRLGAINLAAIEEFETQSERMLYLDRQHADVSQSLDTLLEAIRKIDRETRERFKVTFNQVDESFKVLFPKLFGGGQAYLELLGEDLLDTGVSVIARPPGKRNSSIHLLSGGEKALTAVALVFAIFQLNPAPFCMLDEVDAPLDDANVGRYSEMVREMSDQVQFVFITHNKLTMEIAHQLVGVTMQEPGVSRLVSVDIDAAAAMVEA